MKIKTEEKIRCLKKANYENICLNDFEKFKGLKAIIFDFDNTLYKDIDWLNYNEFVVENVRKIFAYLTDEEFENLLKKHNFNGDRVIESFAKICLEELGSTKKFWNFVKDIKFDGDYSHVKLFPRQILEELSKKYTLFILSNSSVDNIKYVSKQINLDLRFFTKIYDNKFKEDDLTKARSMKDILNESQIKPQQILMVGDSIVHDLIPAKSLGMKVMLIE